METRREEAAPTFPTWRRRLEEAKEPKLREEVDRFLEVLKAVGAPMIDGSAVHFIYYGPEARRVVLTGEFTQWSRRGIAMTPLGDTGIFYHTMQVRGPLRVEYKFIVDGQWMVDPFCPNKVDNGIGEQNSYFVVGDFQDPPELEWVSTIPHGRVEEFDFESKLPNNRRRVYVYLPPDYDEDSTQRFPTFYVHDGGEYLTRARLATVLDNLIHSQAIPPLMAVMIDPVDRAREYWANEGYGRFMEKELLPHIDGRYRTLAQREARGVMGASLGGLISTYLALSRPHLFSKVGGQSSAFFLEEKRMTALAEELEASVAFYFDVGKYEPQFIPAHRRLVSLLEAKGCRCFFQELAGGHNWTSWRAHLKDLLTFLWGEKILPVSVQEPTQREAVQRPVPEPAWPQWDFDTLFSRLLSNWDRLFPGWLRPSGWDPSVEIAMEGDTLLFKVALPEFAPQNVEVLVVGNQIVIKGERTAAQEHGYGSPFFTRSSRFERTLPLPEGVSADQVNARYHDGELEIFMPAPKGMAARRVPIEEK
ncbi:MAG: Hsp20 family protein [Deltaproteobacteria bacterium]|nr:Hsp20 family protein [Deltaproteobacteria bacterium]